MQSSARIALLAASSTLMGACFRFVPATNPGMDVTDGAAQDAADARQDSTPTDITAVDTTDDTISLDAMDATTDTGVATDTGIVDDRADTSAPPPDVRTDTGIGDSCVAPPSGSDAGIAMGSCAMNNGGCSNFATCQQFCDGTRRCTCTNGLTLGADGASCTGLILVSKTSITMPGTNSATASQDVSITRNGRRVAWSSVVETTLRALRCYASDLATNTIDEIGMTRDAMGREQRPEACSTGMVTEDGSRALFLVRGVHPGDPEAPPPWPMSTIFNTVWPYYRDGGGAPRRVNTWQHLASTQLHMENFNLFRFSRDGQRMAFSTRSQVDPMLRPGDSMDFYSASIPIQLHEPYYENVVSGTRMIAPFGAGLSNSRDFDLCGDSNTMVFGTGRRPVAETHPGTDIFVRRIATNMASTVTLNASPDTSGTNTDSRVPTASFDASVTCFVTNSPAFGVASTGEYVFSVRSGSTYTVIRPSPPIPAVDPLANTMSDDGRFVVLATRANFPIAGQAIDSNNATDYYLFDIMNPAAPRPLQRVNLTRTGDQAAGTHVGPTQVRISGDGNAVAFITDQQLVPEDINGAGADLYVRVLR
ncbi:MAG: hypothetical protein JNK05_12865 [Myxococcales bacterium]|nr:hypothetical protein [Myxococcales bacterium]